MGPESLTIRPGADRCRVPLLLKTLDDRRVYFRRGGFEIGQASLALADRRGRTTTLDPVDVATVCLVHIAGRAGGDYRVLLVDEGGLVLAQDTALFYSDADLQRLATAVGCEFTTERFASWEALLIVHPGATRDRRRGPPVRAALLDTVIFVIGLLIVVGILAVLVGR